MEMAKGELVVDPADNYVEIITTKTLQYSKTKETHLTEYYMVTPEQTLHTSCMDVVVPLNSAFGGQ